MRTISSILPPNPETYATLASRYDTATLSHAVLLLGEDGLGGAETAVALAEAKTGLHVRTEIAEWDSVWDKKNQATWMWAKAGQIYYLRPAPAGILIDQIGRLQEALSQQAEGDRWIIIRNADLLRTEAANRLLKTLEEPGPNVFFLLTAESKESVLPTILSRTTQYRLQSCTRREFAEYAQKGLFSSTFADEETLFHVSDGNLGVALAIVDQGAELIQEARNFWLRLTDSSTCYTDGVQAASAWDREHAVLLLRWLTVIARDILWYRVGGDPRRSRCPFLAEDIERLAALWTEDTLLQAEDVLAEAMYAHRLNLSVKLITDMILLRLKALAKGEVNANGGRRPF